MIALAGSLSLTACGGQGPEDFLFEADDSMGKAEDIPAVFADRIGLSITFDQSAVPFGGTLKATLLYEPDKATALEMPQVLTIQPCVTFSRLRVGDIPEENLAEMSNAFSPDAFDVVGSKCFDESPRLEAGVPRGMETNIGQKSSFEAGEPLELDVGVTTWSSPSPTTLFPRGRRLLLARRQ